MESNELKDNLVNSNNSSNSSNLSNSTNLSDSDNEELSSSKSGSESKSETKIKKTRNRLTKKEQYAKERNELIEQLNNIIGIDDKKNYIYLYDLEHNEEIKKKIIDFVPEIKKYHKCGTWGYFLEKERGGDNPIGLLRSVYKDNDIIITTKNKQIDRENKKIISTVYYFNKILK